jgi:hypothetical protein
MVQDYCPGMVHAGRRALRYGLREAVAAFKADCAPPATDTGQDHEPIRAIRLQSLLELVQSGDMSDDERVIREEELFKHGWLEEVGD